MATTNRSGQWRLETLALHGSPALGPTAGAQVTPIHQTAAFDFPSPEVAAARFSLDDAGPIYSRMGNPTVEEFERRIAAVEGGVGAVATASGQAATLFAISAIAGAGDNVVASSSLYGGIYSLLKNTLGRFGLCSQFVPIANMAAWEAAIDERTACLYAEMVGNPLLDTPDLEPLANLAHKHRIPLVIDNTVPTPCLCRPFEFGADVVVHSATKYICGHGTTIGGAVVDSGNFNWGAGRFPHLTTPDPVYGGTTFAEKFGKLAYLARMRAHVMRDMGACMAPMTAWNLIQGIESLPVRMERHCDNAEALAQWLAADARIERVLYPGLDPTNRAARKYLRRGGGMIGLYVAGGYEKARAMVTRTRLFSHAANLGDCRSLIIHPASTTHSPVDPAIRRSIGIEDNFLRLSVGLEHVDDLQADLDQALAG